MPIRPPIPPLDRQTAVIAQKTFRGPLSAKAASALLPANPSGSVTTKAGCVWLPCHLSAHWLFLPTWARQSSTTLNTSHSPAYTATHTRPHITISTLTLSRSFAPALFFSLFPISFQLLLVVRQIWKHPVQRPAFQEHVGSEAIWRGSLSPCSFALFSPLSAYTFPQWIVLKAQNNPGKVTLFDSAVSLNYVSAFISISKYKRIKRRERERERERDSKETWQHPTGSGE